jgi:hypothetical protein
MNATQQMALGLLELMEEQAVEIVALRSVLAQETDEIPDWREQVETAKIVHADRVHQAFEQLRAVILPSSPEPTAANDLDSVVRRLLESLSEDQ